MEVVDVSHVNGILKHAPVPAVKLDLAVHCGQGGAKGGRERVRQLSLGSFRLLLEGSQQDTDGFATTPKPRSPACHPGESSSGTKEQGSGGLSLSGRSGEPKKSQMKPPASVTG